MEEKTITMTKEEFKEAMGDIAKKMITAIYDVIGHGSALMELNDKIILGHFINSASKIIFDDMKPEEVFKISSKEEIVNGKVQNKQ